MIEIVESQPVRDFIETFYCEYGDADKSTIGVTVTSDDDDTDTTTITWDSQNEVWTATASSGTTEIASITYHGTYFEATFADEAENLIFTYSDGVESLYYMK